MPELRRIRPISAVIWRVSTGFMPAVGSSSRSSLGLLARARAISSRRWSPYGRLRADCVVAALAAPRSASHSRRLRRWPPPPRVVASAARNAASNGVACMRAVHAHLHVLEGGHVREQADVLERPADARSATMSLGRALRKMPARCRRCTYQRRPDDRDDERARSGARSPPAQQLARRCSRRGRDEHHDRDRRRPGAGSANQKNGSAQARRGRATTGAPSNAIVPSVGSVRPAMMLKNVVLPAPLGPMRLTIAPSGMSKSTCAPRRGRRSAW